jgi:8-oxo-dGTP pyrophosphatase MutT (NUDIX family)
VAPVVGLDVGRLRERLRRAPPLFAVYVDDRIESDRPEPVAAAVLVPIIDRPDGLSVLFTLRTSHLKKHSGQVSFPGGRAEAGDASAEFTALRESEEEIGLKSDKVEVLARLPDYFTRNTGYRVTPVIGLLTPPFELAPDPNEVEDIFEVPLDFLLDPRNHRRATREFNGRTVEFWEMPYRDRYIWGATAGMVVNLYRFLAGAD